MNREQFDSLLSVIVVDLIGTIINALHLETRQAMEILYNSHLYSLLEEEDTKLWQFSTPRLMLLLKQEIDTGKIEFPDV